jgi:hypothetical protein
MSILGRFHPQTEEARITLQLVDEGLSLAEAKWHGDLRKRTASLL